MRTKFTLTGLLCLTAWIAMLLTGAKLIHYAWYEAPVGAGIVELFLGIGVVSGTMGMTAGVGWAHGRRTVHVVGCAIGGFAAAAVVVPTFLYTMLHFILVPMALIEI